MSRLHFSSPSKSNRFTMPVPVITKMLFPSVTGDGDDMFCLLILKLPPPIGFFHSTLPFSRLRHHSSRLSPSATFRMTRSPQIIGVAPLRLGIGMRQVTFSVLDQATGRFFSPLVPSRLGPRHCGQFSAIASRAKEIVRISSIRIDRIVPKRL